MTDIRPDGSDAVSERRTPIPDGGENADEDGENDGNDTEEEGAEGEESEEREAAETEGETETAEEEENGDEGEDGTDILVLDLEGLYVNLLGVEIDLNEVVLDVSAVPGSGNLLGNLLSPIAGLLDGGVGSRLKDKLPDGGLPSLPSLESERDLPSPSNVLPEGGLPSLPSASELFFRVVNGLLDGLLALLGADVPDESDGGNESEEDNEGEGDEASEAGDGDETEE